MMHRAAASLLVALASVPAGSPVARAESRIDLDLGRRTGEIRWSIAADAGGGSPDVLSELTYDELEIPELRASWEITLARRFVFGARAALGSILDGDNQDSDYAGDGRTLEWSRSNNRVDGDETVNAAISVGYAFRPGAEHRARVVPQVGYSYGAQNLRVTDGFQTLSDGEIAATLELAPPPVGPFAGLDSSFEQSWLGPWVGVGAELPLGQRWGLAARGEAHWADYDAEANWNLRDDLEHPRSFEHDADGTGVVVGVSCHRRLYRAYRVRLQLDYEDRETDRGFTRFFLADGTRPVTRLNGVRWESLGIYLGFGLLRDTPQYSPAPPEP